MINSSTLSSWWNNFNNGDEALFNDSQRPRDSYGFKIQPWMQSNKWNQRDVNKNIYLDQCVVRWARKITSNSTNFYNFSSIKIDLFDDTKWKIDIWTYNSAIIWTVDDDKIEESLKCYKIGGLWWKCKDWKLIIPESWSYFINYYVEFFYNTSHNVSWNYANLAMLYSYTEWWPYAYQYAKQVWYMDNCWWVTIQDLKQWEELWISCNTNNNNEEVLVAWTLIAMKLS